MFEERQRCTVGSQAEEDKLYPYDLLRAELYFPTRKDIFQPNTFSALISVEASSEFLFELRDGRKAKSKYVSDIKGKESMKKASKLERFAYWVIGASNSISEILHASSTVGLKVGGTIHLDHCAAEGQNFSNNDFGRIPALLVTGLKCKNDPFDKPIGVSRYIP